jgi:hypothetical protein
MNKERSNRRKERKKDRKKDVALHTLFFCYNSLLFFDVLLLVFLFFSSFLLFCSLLTNIHLSVLKSF